MEAHTERSHHQSIDRLNDLIALEYDAIAAYEAAVKRLEDRVYVQKLTEFMSDHRRHAQELTETVTMLGGTPRSKGDLGKILTKGKVVLANIGGDKQILQAMKTNEDETNEKYDDAVQQSAANAPERVREVLARALQDERRHREWIVTTLKGM